VLFRENDSICGKKLYHKLHHWNAGSYSLQHRASRSQRFTSSGDVSLHHIPRCGKSKFAEVLHSPVHDCGDTANLACIAFLLRIDGRDRAGSRARRWYTESNEVGLLVIRYSEEGLFDMSVSWFPTVINVDRGPIHLRAIVAHASLSCASEALLLTLTCAWRQAIGVFERAQTRQARDTTSGAGDVARSPRGDRARALAVGDFLVRSDVLQNVANLARGEHCHWETSVELLNPATREASVGWSSPCAGESSFAPSCRTSGRFITESESTKAWRN
jgi:hypothetical protein